MTKQDIEAKINSTSNHNASTIGRRHFKKRLEHKYGKRYMGNYINAMTNSELFDLYKKNYSIYEDEFNNLTLGKKKRRVPNKMYFLYLKDYKHKSEFKGVYVIGNEEYCKIGYTTNLKKRIDTLQVGCPFKLKVLKLFPGLSTKDERSIHQSFKKYNTTGEWFKRNNHINQSLQLNGKEKEA